MHIGPNPFNPAVRIQFHVVRAGHMTLQIYDVRGRLIETLWDDVVHSGPQSHVWQGRTSSGRSVGSGSYFVILRSADGIERRKITLLR
jgi:flagellar hook assembly protein FlgD